MLLTTIENIPGKDYAILGMVEGSTIQSKHIGKDIGASFKTLVGGELKGYAEMLEDSRRIATERMVQKAEGMNADAVIAVRFSSSSVMQGAAEILVYGTAIKYR